MSIEAAASLRCTLIRSVIASLEQPLSPDRTAAVAQLIVGSGLLSAGPDGAQGGLWAPVTELQGKLVEQLLKLVGKGEVRVRHVPGGFRALAARRKTKCHGAKGCGITKREHLKGRRLGNLKGVRAEVKAGYGLGRGSKHDQLGGRGVGARQVGLLSAAATPQQHPPRPPSTAPPVSLPGISNPTSLPP